jgi:hypothetical protein
MSVQSLNNYYGPRDQDAWGWLLSATMPTLSLIVGSYVASVTGSSTANKSVDSLVFFLSILFSAVYLLVVNCILLYSPFSKLNPLDAMHHMNFLLGALQGIVGTCLGVFFTKSHVRSRK